MSTTQTQDQGSTLNFPRASANRKTSASVRATVKRWARQTFSTPIETHVVICGFPRSGTTLLHLMIATSVPARSFNDELPATASILERPMRQRARYLVTKRPNDTLQLDAIRAKWNAERPIKFLLCQRDPRGVLTSMHAGRPGEYYMTPDRWASFAAVWERERHAPDVLAIEFADLVRTPNALQRTIAGWVGWGATGDFWSAYQRVPKGFVGAALNGARPVDPQAITSWQRPEHEARLRLLLKVMPELPDELIAMGYEQDRQWAERYL